MKRLLLSLSLSFSLFSLFLFACAPTGVPGPTISPAPSASPPPPASASTPAPPTETPTGVPSPAIAPSPTPAIYPAPPDPSRYTLRPVAGGLSKPIGLVHAGDSRLFVVEQPGAIRIIENGSVLATPFLDIQSLVRSTGNEQGLLGLAFPPDYAASGYFFVNYTNLDGNTVVARYRVSGDPGRADSNSAETVLTVDQPYPNHNGGDLVFGPDGYLYIGLGDGGSAGDPQGNGQNLQALLGKMLRIDVHTLPYTIPPDNPFVGRGDAQPEIWAYGLRNPWRYSFDRVTGDLYIADVGQNQYEEVDFQPAGSRGGENYGWNFMEGMHTYKGTAPAGLIDPVVEYSHNEGGCSITGGYVYRGAALPELRGVYFYGDYCSGLVWGLYRTPSGWEKQDMFGLQFNISSFGEDSAGEIYLLDHWGGAVYQLAAAP